jgi:hypothetical protein
MVAAVEFNTETVTGPPNLWGADDAYLVFIYGPGHDIYEGRYIICEAGLKVGG